MTTLTRRVAIVAFTGSLPAPVAWAGTPEIRISGATDDTIAGYGHSRNRGEIVKGSAVAFAFADSGVP